MEMSGILYDSIGKDFEPGAHQITICLSGTVSTWILHITESVYKAATRNRNNSMGESTLYLLWTEITTPEHGFLQLLQDLCELPGIFENI
ncbi:hypothetical protein NPIL_65521 [Nephila pilipes]|uniref:Uncharacterized protein n=1 Tax=Nephila pilipes TaxID=299642 RepID=A0A8X6TKE8_NEPPI|nr:hypothetical protein NPIL_65521 [Nephila pilipes]